MKDYLGKRRKIWTDGRTDGCMVIATDEIEKLLKKKYSKVECFEVTFFETTEKARKNESI